MSEAWQTSSSGLLQIRRDAEAWEAQPQVQPWHHPHLRRPVLKVAGLALLAGLLAGLEFTQILKVGVQGLFPALLGLGVGGQLVALQRLRSQGQGLKITHRGLSLLPEQETVPLMPLAALSHLALAQEQTGRLSTQPVLVFCPKDRQAALQWGGGLPEADLNWAKADLEDWLNQL